jgi:hypothetical protein
MLAVHGVDFVKAPSAPNAGGEAPRNPLKSNGFERGRERAIAAPGRGDHRHHPPICRPTPWRHVMPRGGHGPAAPAH